MGKHYGHISDMYCGICHIKYLDKENKKLRRILKEVDEWRGLDGDGITNPLMTKVKEALRSK